MSTTVISMLRLCVAALSGEVYIARVSKRDKRLMTDTRRVIPKEEWLGAIVQWLEANYPNTECIVTDGTGKEVAVLKLVKSNDTNKSEATSDRGGEVSGQ